MIHVPRVAMIQCADIYMHAVSAKASIMSASVLTWPLRCSWNGDKKDAAEKALQPRTPAEVQHAVTRTASTFSQAAKKVSMKAPRATSSSSVVSLMSSGTATWTPRMEGVWKVFTDFLVRHRCCCCCCCTRPEQLMRTRSSAGSEEEEWRREEVTYWASQQGLPPGPKRELSGVQSYGNAPSEWS